MKNYLVIGAGLQGEAIAYDLITYDNDSHVIVVDNDRKRLGNLKGRFPSKRLKVEWVNAKDRINMDELMSEMDVTIGAASYELNAKLAEAAIRTGTDYIDLGGNNTIVSKQFAMHDKAKKAGVTIIPDCGIAPGAVSTIAVKGIQLIGNPDYVHIRVGGLPQHPQGRLKYMKVFSIQGLVNEYIEPVEVLKDYRPQIIPPLGGIEEILFWDEKIQGEQTMLEAAYTSGGLSTLAKTYEGIIKTLDYKTFRYPGHWKIIKEMYDSGAFSDEIIGGITRREQTEALLEKEINYKDKDVMFVQVLVGNDEKEAQFQMVDFYDEKTGHSAMQRTTGYSAAIIAEMLAYDVIKEKGVLNIEKSIDPDVFLPEWERRGLKLEHKMISKNR